MTTNKEIIQNVKRGEIYYADLDPVTGSEQGGTRPVLILQNDIGNRYSPTVIVAPITGRNKKELPTHVAINIETLPKNSIALTEQIRTIDKQRLCEYVDELDEKQMKEVEKAVDISLGKTQPGGFRFA